MTDLHIEPVFWDFSTETYRLEGVAEACLWLQNERGVDVNMLQFCIWYGATRGALDEPCLSEAMQFSDHWREAVVKPLRSARNYLKQAPDRLEHLAAKQSHKLREDIKACELEAEQAQEMGLEQIAAHYPAIVHSSSEARQASATNILRYCEAAQVLVDAASQSRIDLIQGRAIARLTTSH